MLRLCDGEVEGKGEVEGEGEVKGKGEIEGKCNRIHCTMHM